MILVDIYIKDIIQNSNYSGHLSLDEKYYFKIKKGGTQDSIIFEDITFNDFFVWNDNGALNIGDESIVEIHPSRSTNSKSINLNGMKQISFVNCTFDFLPEISNRRIWKIQFNNCTFKDSGQDWLPNILEPTNENKKVYINNCTIESFELGDIRHIRYNSDKKLCYFELTGGSINDLIIQNVEIASKFYINKQYRGNSDVTQITNLTIDNAIFKENFKLHHCNVENIIIEDTDFEKHADFYKSTFNNGLSDTNDKSIYFKALNFRGLALFGDCTFNEKLCFIYVTFEEFCHFRRAKFFNGLDLDYCNIQKEMNFFGIEGLETKQSIENTSQETYRIIKHNFDKIGNTIEGNNFFSLEMKKHKDSLFASPWKENIQKKVVFWLNEKISNFGRNYIQPIIYMILLTIFYKYSIDGTFSAFLYKSLPSVSNVIDNIGNYLNSLVENIGMIKRFLTEGYEFISLFFYITLSILVWQTVVAIKRNTKR